MHTDAAGYYRERRTILDAALAIQRPLVAQQHHRVQILARAVAVLDPTTTAVEVQTALTQRLAAAQRTALVNAAAYRRLQIAATAVQAELAALDG